ncbi:GNAT family N-acetyltransferase [Nocardioides sp. Soil805]|uniref:GNAT family N-acetyltransferase n=1 Tax=Nocardioides sp. Soil805 TaxID=1736416 RepID=UPI00070284C7|nr:GNAT family N-acetyltransferase [Nocardioides sp. Soil805]KRF36382.1 GCN5 family acetyltransferase [Nocardioides sp. Soil805]
MVTEQETDKRTESAQVRLLGPDDRDQFLALAGRDPVVNVFADYRARVTNLEPRWLGGEVWGRFRGSTLVAGCHMGANLVPVGCTADDMAAFADRALSRVRSTATIVGPHEPVAAFWDVVGDRWGPPREARWRQPHLQIDTDPAVRPDPLVRLTTRDDLPALYPACVAMYTEEVGVSPESGGGKDYYRARVQQLISRGWSFARFDEHGRVVFKAEVACATPYAAQVQGVYVHPDHRGRGLSVSGMAAVVELVRRRVAPTVSLYVNEWNSPARAAYARVGFTESARFSTLMF